MDLSLKSSRLSLGKNASQQLFWLYKQAFKAFKVGTEYMVARRVQMNFLYSSSASQKVRGKGLWPVPGLCTRDSVSCLSPKVNINPAQGVSLTGTHTQATLHSLLFASKCNNHNKKLSATQYRRPPGRDLNTVSVWEAVMRVAPG